MVRLIPLLTSLLSFFITPSAQAEDAPKIDDYPTPVEFMMSDECQKNQRMLNYCASKIKQFYELKLESLYQKLEQNDELRAANAAWNDFVDKECKRFAKPFELGSIYPLEIASCKESLTKQRIKALTDELSCNSEVGCSYLE